MGIPLPFQALLVSSLVAIGLWMLLYPEREVRLRKRGGVVPDRESLERYVAYAVERRVPPLRRLRSHLNRAGFRELSSSELLGLVGGVALGGFATGVIVFGGWLVGLMVGGAFLVLMWVYIEQQRVSREARLEEQVERLVAFLLTRLAGQADIRSALMSTVAESTEDGQPTLRAMFPAPLGPELAALVADMHNRRATQLRALLEEFRARVDHTSCDLLVNALVQGDLNSGRGLAEMLEQVRLHVHEQGRLRRDIASAMAMTTSQVYVVAALPILFTVINRLTGEAGIQTFFGSVLGQAVVAGYLGLSWLGVVAVRRLARPESLVSGASFE